MSMKCTGNYVIQTGSKIVVNGEEIDIPKHIQAKGDNSTIINGRVFINGWELKKDKTWKKTFLAFWHSIF